MNKKKFILSLSVCMVLVKGIAANNLPKDVEVFDINTVEYIEEEEEIDLGFDVADYLPDGFDPHKMYVDLNAIAYVEEELEIADLSKYLPEGFDAYAFPTDVHSINYIDENDSFTLDFDTKKHLPEGFNPYIK